MNIRCSSLPLAWNCASSLEAPAAGEALINQSSEPAELGNAVHRYLAAHVAGTDLDIGQLAKEHGCDPDELGFLSAQGRKLLKELGKYIDLSKAESEVPMSVNIGDEITVTGTGDLCDRQTRRWRWTTRAAGPTLTTPPNSAATGCCCCTSTGPRSGR